MTHGFVPRTSTGGLLEKMWLHSSSRGGSGSVVANWAASSISFLTSTSISYRHNSRQRITVMCRKTCTIRGDFLNKMLWKNNRKRAVRDIFTHCTVHQYMLEKCVYPLVRVCLGSTRPLHYLCGAEFSWGQTRLNPVRPALSCVSTMHCRFAAHCSRICLSSMWTSF